MFLKKPREGRQSILDSRKSSVATTWLSVLSRCRHPTASAVGHILAPLMRLGVGRRCYSSVYAPLGERVTHRTVRSSLDDANALRALHRHSGDLHKGGISA